MKKESKKPEDAPQEVAKEAEFNPEFDMPTKLEHFPIYNRWARKNKVPVRVPNEDYYPKVKVRFQRFDQPSNVLKCRIRNKDIDWTGQLIPGCVYDLCLPVVHWLTSLAEPIFAEVRTKNDAGGGRFIERTETKQVGERARFSCMPLEFTGAM